MKKLVVSLNIFIIIKNSDKPMKSEGRQNDFSDPKSLSSRNDDMQLDINIFEFLRENHYVIVNDNVYVSLEAMIDENPEVFHYKFEHVVKKSIGLIYYTVDLKNVSAIKKQLKEQLMGSFTGTRNLISTLSNDHHLLLRLYSAFYKYRIKFFMKEGETIRSYIYGDKEATTNVKILFDSVMFYLLVENVNESSSIRDSSYRSPSPIGKNSRNLSPLSSTTLRLISTNISKNERIQADSISKGSIKSIVPSNEENKRRFKNSQLSNSKVNYSQIDIKFTDEFFGTNVEHVKQISSHNFLSVSKSDRTGKVITWKNFTKSSKCNRDQKGINYSSDGLRSARFGKLVSGSLVGYSASRQCGFLITDDELDVIVVYDELLAAGVPTELLDISSNNIHKKTSFILRKLAVEPVATFEAVELIFSKTI